MIYFPQLSSGATGQFPIRRRRTTRTVVNRSSDGCEIKLADPGASFTQWHLSYQELSDQELAALEALFQAVEGSLTSFTFLDPADNLLCWSEKQDAAAWQPDPLLQLSGGIADPLGGTGAYLITNPTSTFLTLQQSINAPASLCYCLSVFARSDPNSKIWLIRGSDTDCQAIGPEWTRVSSAGQLQSEAESISFGVGLAPNSTAQIFGVQVEAQPAASLYKSTEDSGGVYDNARFASDAMLISTAGPGRHACEVDIIDVERL